MRSAPALPCQTRCALHAQPGSAAELGSKGRSPASGIDCRPRTPLVLCWHKHLNHWQIEQAYVPHQEDVRIARAHHNVVGVALANKYSGCDPPPCCVLPCIRFRSSEIVGEWQKPF